MKASMVVMSHLSDAQEKINMGCALNGVTHEINFAKYIILQTKCDLNQEINPEEMYTNFLNKK